MDERHKKILSAVIEEYTNSAIPVGSKILVEKYGFEISPATIRSVMAELEEAGLLYQPHTSAGRIPTDKGYRFFVEKIMPDQSLSIAEQKRLQSEMLKLKAHNQRLSRTTAKLLSSFSGNLAITGVKEDLYDFGIAELLDDPEFQKIDEFSKVIEVLDYIDENIDAILKEVKHGETKIFIGKENPIKEISNCSMMVTPWKSKSGEWGILALIGPKRMKYAKNKSLLNYVKKLLGSSAVVIIMAGSVEVFLK